MLSLSIYSSSQRISIALYQNNKLKKFFEKKIKDRKIDDIFLLVKKIFEKKNIKIDSIFFSTGPGSYTAQRSIKAIAQGISLITKSKIKTVSEFDVYLSNLEKKRKNVIVFFKAINNNYFFRHYRLFGTIYKSKKKYENRNFLETYEYINKKKIKIKDLIVLSDSSKNIPHLVGFKNNEVFSFKTSAKDIARAVFLGYGKNTQEINYHHTYYE